MKQQTKTDVAAIAAILVMLCFGLLYFLINGFPLAEQTAPNDKMPTEGDYFTTNTQR